MKTLTIITTTYNRAYCLHQVYESLCRQTCNDFLWLIIDDGSTDNTAEIVKRWENEGLIEIEYYYKANGGMHTARNIAYEKCHTLLNVIIDSDDWMTDDAVGKIVLYWRQHGADKYYGIAAENISISGEIIGTSLPYSVQAATCTDLFWRYGVNKDKKFILRSDLSKMYPYPEFEGEKFYPASYKFKMLDQYYKLLIMHEPVCVVNYTQESMTYNKYSQYRTCSKGFSHYRNEMMRITRNPKANIKNVIHYIAEAKFSGNRHYIRTCSKPLYAGVFCPAGLLYYYYLLKTNKKY